MQACREIGACIARRGTGALSGSRKGQHHPCRIQRIAFESRPATEPAIAVPAMQEQADLRRSLAPGCDQCNDLPSQILGVAVRFGCDGVGEIGRNGGKHCKGLRGLAPVLQGSGYGGGFVGEAAVYLDLGLQPG